MASHRQKWWNLVKRETAPTSDSAQFILAWWSKDSVESVGSSQSEAQPGSGCNAIPGAAQSGAQSGGSKKPGARAVTQQTWNYARQAASGRVWCKGEVGWIWRSTWGKRWVLGKKRERSKSWVRRRKRRDIIKRFFFGGERNRWDYKSKCKECHWTRSGLRYERVQRGGVWKKLEDKGRCGGVLKYMSGERMDERRRTSRTVCHRLVPLLPTSSVKWRRR